MNLYLTKVSYNNNNNNTICIAPIKSEDTEALGGAKLAITDYVAVDGQP